MKKAFTSPIIKVIIIGLILSFSQVSFSQSGIRFGIRGGAHAGTQTGRAIFYYPAGTLIGFHGGIFANIELSEDISLCPEIAFSQKGFKIDTAQITSNYFEVPLLLKVNMGDEGLYTIVGPYLSYLPTVNINAPDEKALSWGGTIGLGYRLGDHLFLEGRYNFNSRFWSLGSDSLNPYGFRNTTIGLSLGYLF
jgi:Outer membrane protein beta-barrel domain